MQAFFVDTRALRNSDYYFFEGPKNFFDKVMRCSTLRL